MVVSFTVDSGSTRDILVAFLASLSAVSLPCKPVCPLIHHKFTLLHLLSLFRISVQVHIFFWIYIVEYRCFECSKLSENMIMIVLQLYMYAQCAC